MKKYPHLVAFLEDKNLKLEWQHAKKMDFSVTGEDTKGKFVRSYFSSKEISDKKGTILIGNTCFVPEKKKRI